MAATPFKVKAVFDYTSGHDDDLSFNNGQIITITDVEDDDWYYGEYPDAQGVTKQGLFPKNFVERYEPITPPRPSRSVKREQDLEPELLPQTKAPSKSIPQAIRQSDSIAPAEEEDNAGMEERAPIQTTIPAAVATTTSAISRDGPSETRDLPIRSTTDTRAGTSSELEQATRAVPAPPTVSKSPPPTVAEKPAASSFRDRIAAFNKSAAPPVAPIKPGQAQGSSFIKKPFVPPPPSRNAYVPVPKDPPPQKVYRREEDSSMQDAVEEHVTSGSAPMVAQEGDEEDQPKPTSLKERIALLQKQQLEQAARHAEGASKKEKPKKPPPRKPLEALSGDGEEVAAVTGSGEHATSETEEERDSLDAIRPSQAMKSKDHTQIASQDTSHRDLMNDPNDADQSAGGDTEDGEPSTIKRVPKAPSSIPYSVPPVRQPSQEDDIQPSTKAQTSNDDQEAAQEVEDGDEEGEEEDIDPEIRRRMEIRERMAKMSGGMGMAGMFGPPGGLPALGAKKHKSESGSTKQAEEYQQSSPPSQPVPIMALPGMSMPGLTKTKSLEHGDANDNDENSTHAQSQLHEEPESEEDSEEETQSSSRPLPPPPTERPVPLPPASRAVPPVPTMSTSRAPPLPPSDTRPLPPPSAAVALRTSSQFLSTGEDSDDELSTAQEVDTPNITTAPSSARRALPPPIPFNIPNTGPETAPISPTSAPSSPKVAKSSTFPLNSNTTTEKRVNRSQPPVPGAFSSQTSSPPAARAPPPPPPNREADQTLLASGGDASHEESEEVTEYEGDYDTDIAAGDSHKDALTADQSSSADETLTGDEASYHHSGLPSIGPPPSMPPLPGASAPRGAPPPPPPREPPRPTRQSSDLSRPPPPLPTQAPSKARQSNDLPRGAPPPIPQQMARNDDEYDPFNYSARPSLPTRSSQKSVETPRVEHQFDDLYGSSSPVTARGPPAEPSSEAPPPTFTTQQSSTNTRQSLDASRAGPARASMDTRTSMDNTTGYMAHEIDVGRSSHWWTQRKMPPPSIQNRSDITFEIEESTAIQQDGSELVLKHVYILFVDYSQTTLTARYLQTDPSKAEFSQRFEGPPPQLRQDQLETAHEKFGSKIAERANQHVNHVVGNGTPMALVSDLLNNLPDAAPVVGTRAFGAVVYANMANATVQQLDEIRTGDIISFRNTKMQGHKGPMKQKYNIDVGKPDHVAIVVDWDGTKKKIRAWEQGRESKKVKIESFKLGDLRSGEVKIWRVVGREWIGWGNKL